MTYRNEPAATRITRRVVGMLAAALITFGLLTQVTSMADIDNDEATPPQIAAINAATSPN